ncbi:MAG: Ig-like domain-containing protein [Microbacterium gubbeenense]|uniref:Ig-like domain-containing protein n=1 Tax=Microbacterium gubbeenense TaxID=159896 RepID=UPI003F956F55
MTAAGWLRGRRGAITGTSIVAAGAIALTAFAVAYDGNPTAEVELDAGSVWVTKTSSEVLGHLNSSSALLDGQLRGVTSDRIDVMQERDGAVIFDSGDSTLARIDGADMVLGDRVQIPAGSVVQRGADTVAIFVPSEGDLYLSAIDEIGSFDPSEAEPIAELGADAVMTVGTDGTVHTFEPDGAALTTYAVGSDGSVAGDPEQQTLEAVTGSDVEISSVGGTPVVLDRAGGIVATPDGLETSIGSSENARLAADAPRDDVVRVATETSLADVPLDGSEAALTANGGASGAPLQPVVAGECAYAAWQGTQQIVRDCADSSRDVVQTIDGASSDGLVFRTNGSQVVLNDASGGSSWLASEDMQHVNNWDDLTPPEGDGQESDEVEENQEAEVQPPERTAENREPDAEDDTYGVRPGRSAVLPVLDNDSDPDGDVLTITVDEQPGAGQVQTIQDGQALQVTMPENASGTGTFRYTVSDGRGGSDSARVDLSVHDPEENLPPAQKDLRPTVAVESGGSVTYNVLPDWIDPDGDDIYLSNVTPAEGDEVDFTADGQITYRALAAYEGPLAIDVTVSDGTDVATAELSLDVRPVGTVQPVTNADHVQLFAGESATVEPLINDINAASEDLTLSQVTPPAEVEVTADAQGGVLNVESETPGTYYVDYAASAGALAAPGVIRVDVLENKDKDAAPVAVRDTAYLPGGGEVLIDALQNDYDPSAGVLVVQSVEAPDGSGVSAAVLGHSTIQLTDRAMLEDQVVVTYRISNGARSATGEIIVIPVPATDQIRPPIAADDTATVRAGDIVTVPVTENDSHPNGDSFEVLPDFVEQPDASAGDIFVSQDTVRFRAAADAEGQVEAVYSIIDSKGQRDSATVRINISPWNEQSNSAPIPEHVTGRAIAGSTSRIEIPLDRIDPDGDSVDLIGISSAPSKGKITATGTDFLSYEADRGASGVDSFSYRVVDTFGVESIGTVRVGIAPSPGTNQAPNAMSDTVAVRPGRTVSIPVLANDSDPEGDQIGLVPDSAVSLSDDSFEVETTNDRVLLTASETEGESQLQYAIEDAVGNSAKGVVHVTVANDVPLERPIARDDGVLIDDVSGEFTADIDLLANDEDPDGTADDLDVAIDGVEMLASEGPGVVRVAVEDRRRAIPYTVTDADGGVASAFLVVPAKNDLRPVLVENAGLVIQSDTLVEISLADVVQVAEGRSPRITSADAVSVKHGNGDALVKDPQTLQYRSEYRYEGTDDITFEVTDGNGPDDPNGRVSVLTIPITVTEPRNEAPEFTNTSTTIGAGDGPVSVDLSQRTYDIDGDDLQYSLENPDRFPEGVSVKLDGTTLTMEASAEARGRDTTVGILVDDGEADPVRGEVGVSVAASGRPLPSANDDDLGEVHQGTPIDVDVLANDTNPFEGEGPLTIVDAEVEAGDAEIEVVGDQVVLTPGSDFHGYVTARYTIADVTDDADRYVQASITATVLGVAEKPGTPQASEIGNRTATLTWTAPSNNGAEITEYVVEDYLGSGYAKTCDATVCQLDGLVNDREYQFQVTAVNEVGNSQTSELSRVVRPDVKPEAPGAPSFTLEAGHRDSKLGIAWNTPASEGSPVTGYLVRVDDGTGVKLHRFEGSTITSRVFEGLKNGQKYRFQVAAMNRADIQSVDGWSWSPWSAYEKPATVPDAPSAPSVERTDQPYGENEFRLSWKPGESSGGDPISSWRVDVMKGDEVYDSRTIANSGTATTVVVPNSENGYSFRVAAVNREGTSKWSAMSKPIRSASRPGPVSPVNVAERDGAIDVAWQAADPNGARKDEISYQYKLTGEGGDWKTMPSTGSSNGRMRVEVPATNGVSSTVIVRAVTKIDGVGTLAGDEAKSEKPARPYGKLAEPTASVNPATVHSNKVVIDVSAHGNGREIEKIVVRTAGRTQSQIDRVFDGPAAMSVDFRAEFNEGMAPGTTQNVQVVVVDTAGQRSEKTIKVGVPAPSFELDYHDNDPKSPDGNKFTLNFEHLPPLYSDEYWFTCERHMPWGWRDIGSQKLEQRDGGAAGSVRVTCIDTDTKPGDYRVKFQETSLVPEKYTTTNSVTVKVTPTPADLRKARIS